ncbi:Protein shq1 [Smittium culicis]|uniref:Protein shq1 n=1 Tax=Smittium culicis TaxID=133412 RepID=A0A1R1YP77_9FUNG|nr:Protein shq1 [Smittium culicis]
MITPKFQVTQDDDYIYISIFITHVKASNIEFDVDGNEFRFFANPYYLRLKLTGQVIETEDSTAKLDISEGKLQVKLSKLNKGQFFPDLDLLSLLLATRSEANDITSKNPLIIEELDDNSSDLKEHDNESDQDTDWEIPQSLEEVNFSLLFIYLFHHILPNMKFSDIIITATYGFNRQYNGWFTHVDQTANEINCIQSPETTSNSQRTSKQHELEDTDFNEDYYMSNFIDDDEIEPLIESQSKFESDLNSLLEVVGSSDLISFFKKNQFTSNNSIKNLFEFTEKEKEYLIRLPKKTYIIDDKKSLYLGIVDILFAYAYNNRVFEGENNVESVWTIGIISASCSCLRNFDSLKQTIVSFYRRSLTYPLFRNWDLSEKVYNDVINILKLGKRYLLKIFLDIKDMFDHHDIYYVYSKVIFDDYCVWIQNSAKDTSLISLSEKLQALSISKDDIGWPLEQYEDLVLESSSDESDNESIIGSENINTEIPTIQNQISPIISIEPSVPEISKSIDSLAINPTKKKSPLIQEL